MDSVICILLAFISFQVEIKRSTFNIDRKITKSSVIQLFVVTRCETSKIYKKKMHALRQLYGQRKLVNGCKDSKGNE